jgi:hypothetical protein
MYGSSCRFFSSLSQIGRAAVLRKHFKSNFSKDWNIRHTLNLIVHSTETAGNDSNIFYDPSVKFDAMTEHFLLTLEEELKFRK